jgi:indolepyruvate ferredoxin oxidoreductase beta subunit
VRPGFDVVLAGVAGQPVWETALLLGSAALAAGLEVSVSETPPAAHGRGAVAVHVRAAAEVRSPIIPERSAGALLGFEALEALRAAPLLAPDGFAAVNEHLAPTWRMRAGLDPAPHDVTHRLQAFATRVVGVRAEALVRRLDGPPLIGLALLGVAVPLLGLPEDAWEAALLAGGAPGLEARRHALARGRRLFEALPARLGRAQGAAAR